MTDGIPRDFSDQQREEAEFWAWLSQRYLVPKKGVTEQLEIISLDQLKTRIQEEMESKGHGANELIDLTLSMRENSDLILRKSIRVGRGEYLKLTRIKLAEDTSLSNVVVRLLRNPLRQFLGQIKTRAAGDWASVKDRWDRLHSLVGTWESQVPEPRSRDLDIELYWYKDRRFVRDSEHPPYPERALEALANFVIKEVENKIYEGHPKTIWPPEFVNISEFYLKSWRKFLDQGGLPPMVLRSRPDPDDKNALIITPVVAPAEVASSLFEFDQEREEELFATYGKDNVLSLVNSLTVRSGLSSEDNETYKGLEQSKDRIVSFSWEVELTPCRAIAKGRDEIEVELASGLVTNQGGEAWAAVWSTIEEMGNWMSLKPSDYFATEMELAKTRKLELSAILVSSQKLATFLKLATKIASTPQHFEAIKHLNSYRLKISDREQIASILQDLVDRVLSRRSVVSFYINSDLAKALPLVLGKANWLAFADNYLASKPKLAT